MDDLTNSPSGSDYPKAVVERGYDQAAHEYAQLEGDDEWPRMGWLRKVLNRARWRRLRQSHPQRTGV